MVVTREAAFVAVLGLVVPPLFAACGGDARTTGSSDTRVGASGTGGTSGTGGIGAGGSGGGATTQTGGGPHCDGFACVEGHIVVATCNTPPKLCDPRASGGVECVPAGSECPRVFLEAGVDAASDGGPAPPGVVEAGGVCPHAAMVEFNVTIPALPGGTAVIGSFNSAAIEFKNGSTDAPMEIRWTVCPQTTLLVSRFDANHRPLSTRVSSAACLVDYPGPARVWHVPGDSSTIQAAIDAASGGDTVLVAPGVYFENLKLRSGVTLRGQDARTTILDGQGRGANLVDFTGARDVVVTGFTFRSVGQRAVCAGGGLGCAGDLYSAAVYAYGNSAVTVSPCAETTGFIAGNIFDGNDIGVLLYYLPEVVVANNVFLNNRGALVANHLAGARGLALHNVFRDNASAISFDAVDLHVVNNVFSNSPRGEQYGWDGTGRSMCNVFDDLSVPTSNSTAESGNLLGSPSFADPATGDFSLSPGSVGVDAGCFSPDLQDLDGSPPDTGAFGGPWAMPHS